ncbi:hypothetical protein, partial [Vibrio anguillarum]
KRYAKKVLMGYVNGGYQVCYSSDDWYEINSRVDHNQCSVSELSKYHKLKRLRGLVSKGLLLNYDNSNTSFWINNYKMKAAHAAAREFWLSQGLRSADEGSFKTMPQLLDGFDELLVECENMLLNR